MLLSSRPRSIKASFSYLIPLICSKSKHHTSTTVMTCCCCSTYSWPQPTPFYVCFNFTCFCSPSPRRTSCCPTQKETILPLRDNWYLVHSPHQFTGHITCCNLSNSKVFLKPGRNRFYISPSCRLQLADHLVISDVSLKLDNVIKHYEWELDKITFTDEEEAPSTDWLTVLNNEKAGRTKPQCHLSSPCH